jgi:hypothetical protein
MNIEIGATYRHHDATEPHTFIRVDDLKNGKVVFFPVSGGFQAALPVDKFKEHYVVVPPQELKRLAATFTIEHFDFDEWTSTIPAWTNGTRWNGWGQPYFEREVIKQAIDDGLIGDGSFVHAILFDDGVLTVQTQSGTIPADHDWSEVIEMARNGDEVYDHKIAPGVVIEAEFFPSVVITAEGRQIETYPVGAGSWCWNQYKEPRVNEEPAPATMG